MSFEIAVQQAVYNQLTANAALMAVITKVYDDVPSKAVFPYITIGEDNHVNADTDTELMRQVSITVHVWCRNKKSGRKQTKTIQGLVEAALHRAELTHTGYHFITITQSASQSAPDADGITRHGVQTFNLLVEEL